MGKKKKRRRFRDFNYSALEDHRRSKKTLTPPMNQIPGMKHNSWIDERLPDLLWCALFRAEHTREDALKRFRGVASHAKEWADSCKHVLDLSLSGIERLPDDKRESLVSLICHAPIDKPILAPLLLLKDLPARETWARHLPLPAKEDAAWHRLAKAVAVCFDHQSEEATDCRWARVLFNMVGGCLKLPNEESVKEIYFFPDYGDLRKVRPTIRATELMFPTMMNYSNDWPRKFWEQCFKETSCSGELIRSTHSLPSPGTTAALVTEVQIELANHFRAGLASTEKDIKRDVVFGLAAYSLVILRELLRIGLSSSVLGRLGLRTLLECWVNLRFIEESNDEALWARFREYGYGQVKLAFLKLDEIGDAQPEFISQEALFSIANEEKAQEFTDIDIGHWCGKNLRQMSEGSSTKSDYESLYPWTSAFTHANWGAIRNSSFGICSNPLHRLHKVLLPNGAELGDVIVDAAKLVDRILEVVDRHYPSFTRRVSMERSGAC